MEPEEPQELDSAAAPDEQIDAAQPEDVQADAATPGEVQYDAQGNATTYADGSPFERDAYGNIIYDEEPETPAAPPAPAPFSTPTAAAPNVQLLPILSNDEQAQMAAEGFTPEAQAWVSLIASRIASRSEQSMIASNSNLQSLQQKAPELFNVVGTRVAAQMANLSPEVRARPDAAGLAVLMAQQEEARTTGQDIFAVQDRWNALRRAKPAAARVAPAPQNARQKAPGASPNAAPRPSHTQQQRTRAPRVGVGLNLTAEEQRILEADPRIMGNQR